MVLLTIQVLFQVRLSSIRGFPSMLRQLNSILLLRLGARLGNAFCVFPSSVFFLMGPSHY